MLKPIKCSRRFTSISSSCASTIDSIYKTKEMNNATTTPVKHCCIQTFIFTSSAVVL